MIVVKVGGSLFDWPELAVRLRAWLGRPPHPRPLSPGGEREGLLLVPGGGATANVIRAFDRTHGLGEEASHWLAIQALSLNARFLQSILSDAKIVEPNAHAREAPSSLAWASGSVSILDAFPFFQDDERRPDHLPHHWEVTSDSLAVRTAILVEANELILLKSMAWEGTDWLAASAAGVVDRYFPHALQQAKCELRVRVVNLRDSEV